MQTPSYLTKGDTVAIVATGKRVDATKVEASIPILESWGLKVQLGKYVFEGHNYFSATDEHRLLDLQWSLDNPDLKAVLFARGGYGTGRIIDKLDFSKFRKKPKWLVGFSDITVVHTKLQHLGIESIHGTMPQVFQQQSPESLESLHKVLFGQKSAWNIKYHDLNRVGRAEGRLVGGNISLLAHLIGSPYELDTRGKILFLEEVGEYLYNLDRMLHQLYRAGKFKKLAGLLIGQISDSQDNDPGFGRSAYEIIADIVAPYSFPVMYDLPIGHGADNLSVICGRHGKMNVKSDMVELAF
jgi:muramoyltetrapeptide carboxypeptidase